MSGLLIAEAKTFFLSITTSPCYDFSDVDIFWCVGDNPQGLGMWDVVSYSWLEVSPQAFNQVFDITTTLL